MHCSWFTPLHVQNLAFNSGHWSRQKTPATIEIEIQPCPKFHILITFIINTMPMHARSRSLIFVRHMSCVVLFVVVCKADEFCTLFQ